MESKSADMYGKARFCPAYGREIEFELCYESAHCLAVRQFKPSSVPELSNIKDLDVARGLCRACPYSDME